MHGDCERIIYTRDPLNRFCPPDSPQLLTFKCILSPSAVIEVSKRMTLQGEIAVYCERLINGEIYSDL